MTTFSTDLFNGRVSLQPDLTSRDKAIASWVQRAAGKGAVPFDRVYDADVAFGHCLIGMDGCRMHLDWFINTLPFSPIPERYNEDINLMIDLLATCQRTSIHAETELTAVEATMQKHLQPQPEVRSSRLSRFMQPVLRTFGRSGTRYRFPFLPLQFKIAERHNVPPILVNYHYLREALTGFSGQVTLWYHERDTTQIPVAFGTPGQRLAIVMPAVLS